MNRGLVAAVLATTACSPLTDPEKQTPNQPQPVFSYYDTTTPAASTAPIRVFGINNPGQSVDSITLRTPLQYFKSSSGRITVHYNTPAQPGPFPVTACAYSGEKSGCQTVTVDIK